MINLKYSNKFELKSHSILIVDTGKCGQSELETCNIVLKQHICIKIKVSILINADSQDR